VTIEVVMVLPFVMRTFLVQQFIAIYVVLRMRD